MTVIELLQRSVRTLNGICVPVGLKEMIAEPISGVVDDIARCIETMTAKPEGGDDDKT